MIMIYADEKSCRAAGVDPKKVESLARRLNKLGKEAEKMGLFIFGGSGTGTLRTEKEYDHGQIVVGVISYGGTWDGGDGGIRENDGIQYGE